jgi:hypothetical protein
MKFQKKTENRKKNLCRLEVLNQNKMDLLSLFFVSNAYLTKGLQFRNYDV